MNIFYKSFFVIFLISFLINFSFAFQGPISNPPNFAGEVLYKEGSDLRVGANILFSDKWLGPTTNSGLYIRNDGKILINTSTLPDSNAVLTVFGNLFLGNQNTNYYISSGLFYDLNSPSYYVDPYPSFLNYSIYARKGAVFETGNVGIGTINPGYKLDIVGGTDGKVRITGTPSSDGVGYFIDAGASGNMMIIQGGGVGQIRESNHFAIFTGGSERVRITSSGNVGIGTTTPSQKLDVVGNILVGGDIYGGLLGGTRGIWRFSTTYPDYGIFYTEATPDVISISPNGGGITNPVMVINGNGNVGIGTTSPSYKLHVEGTGYFSQPVVVGIPTLSSHAATKSYVDNAISNITSTLYWTANGNNIYNTNTGNVGIGTTTSSQKLTVAGNIGIQAGANSFIGTLDNYALSLRTNTDRTFSVIIGSMIGIGLY